MGTPPHVPVDPSGGGPGGTPPPTPPPAEERIMKQIVIEFIPHDHQRYETVGDWFFDAQGDLHIRVSDLGNFLFNFLVASHELVEVVLCMQHGVTQEEVDKFDMEFELARQPGNVDEPGDNMLAPYYSEHQLASGVERLLAAMLGVNWKEYERKVEEL